MAEPAQTQSVQNEFHTDLSVGEILRRTRTHYNLSPRDVERATRIRAEQIEAIEQGAIDKLPGKVYAIGFVRSYADYLGLDGEKIVHLFKNQYIEVANDPQLRFPVAAGETKAPPLWLAVIALIVLCIFIAGWAALTRADRSIVEDIPTVPEGLQSSTLEAQMSAPPQPDPSEASLEASTNTPQPSPGIILRITQNSWVEIRDSTNKVLLSRVLKAGDQYFVPDRPDLSISIGNAGGVALSIDGQNLRPLGNAGDVIRALPLNAQALKAEFGTNTPQNSIAQTPQ
ncbi:MAG: helix-turn-helix domain-containing protein [Bdellovibrionales bacterium]